MKRRALIFGVSGQAGSYLAELLLQKDYEVYGTYWHNGEKCPKGLHGGEALNLTSPHRIGHIMAMIAPDEVYNMAAKMFVSDSWKNPYEYVQVNGLAVVSILDAIQNYRPVARFFQAGSADIFGNWPGPLDADCHMEPESPYGVAKQMAREMVRVYRQEKGMFACTGIFYNMESPRRPDSFFARKVVKAALAIRAGRQQDLELDGLGAIRDWGLTEEYVEAAWLMLQAKQPKEYVIATGESHTCEEFVNQVFWTAGAPVRVRPSGKREQGLSILRADPSEIKRDLGWEAKTKFYALIKHLVEEEKKLEVHQQPVR